MEHLEQFIRFDYHYQIRNTKILYRYLLANAFMALGVLFVYNYYLAANFELARCIVAGFCFTALVLLVAELSVSFTRKNQLVGGLLAILALMIFYINVLFVLGLLFIFNYEV